MSSAQMTTKWSPGPIYMTNGNQRYSNAPRFGFGTSKKNPLDIKGFCYEEAQTVLMFF